MTFSIAGYCQRSGMLGVAITTSSICVGARCPWVRAGAGAVATQNITDPRLGDRLLDLMQQGLAAQTAMDTVVAEHPHIQWRQLTAVDASGRTAMFTGTETLATHAATPGEHCVAAGNLLRNTEVPAAMVAAFAAGAELHLAARLLGALRAGLDAGGEGGPVHSSALLVAHEQQFPLVDLRVDWDDADPLARLQALWDAYQPQMQDYLLRALDPGASPSYGVPGDP